MATEVVMPQMGESIAEGTIVRWIKKVGDRVERDEPLFEISTDKVDAEIPSPAAGVLAEIKANEGERVPVDSVVAVIAEAGTAVAAPKAVAQVPPAAPPAPPKPPAVEPAPERTPPPSPAAPVQPVAAAPPEGGAPSPDEMRRQRSSPLVRRIAREHDVDIAKLEGTGAGGRVTKQDILGFIES